MRNSLISKEVPVRAQIVQRLRTAITEGMFQPGDHLVERDLCEYLGVSRTSLREALREIEAEGLIEFFPNKGAIVREITVGEVLELWEIRSMIERLIARRFAVHGTEQDVARLEAAIAAMDSALKAQDRHAIKIAKMELWDSFSAGGHQAACAKLMLQINARLSFLWSSSLLFPGRPMESIAEFSNVVSAIRNRSPDVAEAAIVLHNANAKMVALRGLEAFETARKGIDTTKRRVAKIPAVAAIRVQRSTAKA